MGPWQTGREGAWSLAERGGTLGGASGGARKDPGLNEREEKVRKMLETEREKKHFPGRLKPT